MGTRAKPGVPTGPFVEGADPSQPFYGGGFREGYAPETEDRETPISVIVALDPDTQIMALNGTREGLYNATMALCPETKNGRKPAILMPNPFYPVYMIAALSTAADPIMVPATLETGYEIQVPPFVDEGEIVKIDTRTGSYVERVKK